ncbi:MAG: ABC transporter substrate-binding protein, partial [Akkermansiaceae bacterium]|nr:ABC transporter substrate-binding protein [Akkermansiaceae bacterium]
LVVFMAGNQFMAMSRLMEAFRERHPEIERVFYETLPPGLELKQILAGGAVFEGREITGSPDVYTAVSASAMESLREAGRVDEWS